MTRAIKHLHLRFALAAALGLFWAGVVGSIESEPEISASADGSCAIAAAATTQASARAC